MDAAEVSVIGIDLSLRSTGIGVITDTAEISCWSRESTGKRADTLAMRSDRLRALATGIIGSLTEAGTIRTAKLAVIESPSYGSKGGSSWDRAGLWWMIVDALHQARIPVALCAPPTRAKYATGSGRADKAAVAMALARLLPEADIVNSDESDALVLAHMGAAYLHYPVATLARHTDSIAAVHWPVLPATPVAVPALAS